MVLYRKYRPKNFSEVVGQEHVVETLQGAIQTGRLAHAYLFTGPRGTGKTSTARILAKMVNCENSVIANPEGVKQSNRSDCFASLAMTVAYL